MNSTNDGSFSSDSINNCNPSVARGRGAPQHERAGQDLCNRVGQARTGQLEGRTPDRLVPAGERDGQAKEESRGFRSS